MVNAFDSARINKQLKDITGEYKRRYEILRQQSEDRYKTSLKVGDRFFSQQGFYDNDNRSDFDEDCKRLRAKARTIIDKASEDIMKQNTAAPSAEAVNVVTLINSRQDVPAEEIDQLMSRYGQDCPMVYRALYDKAMSLGYRDFKQHPIAEAAEKVEDLNRQIGYMDVNHAENNVNIIVAALETTIDSAFPAGGQTE